MKSDTKRWLKMETVRIDLRRKDVDIEEVRSIRRNLAKRANQRLRVLEKNKLTKNAYRVATRYTQQTRGKDRFSEAKMVKADMRYLKQEILELERFLNSVTSTLTGYKKLEQQRLKVFRDYGLKVKDTQEFFDFLDSEIYKQLANKAISSDILQEFYDTVKSKKDAKKEEIQKALEKFREGNIDTIDELYEEFDLTFME